MHNQADHSEENSSVIFCDQCKYEWNPDGCKANIDKCAAEGHTNCGVNKTAEQQSDAYKEDTLNKQAEEGYLDD